MHDPQEWNLEKIRGFLQNDPGSECQAGSRQELYGWIQATLVEQEYFHLRKKERGLVRAFLSRVTRLGPAHLTRLIRQYRRAGTLHGQSKTRRRFATTYTREDVALVAETDRLHQRLSGPATRCLFERAWKQFGDPKFERLTENISSLESRISAPCLGSFSFQPQADRTALAQALALNAPTP